MLPAFFFCVCALSVVNYVAANEIFYYYHRNFSTFSLRLHSAHCRILHFRKFSSFYIFPCLISFSLSFRSFVIILSCCFFSISAAHDIHKPRAFRFYSLKLKLKIFLPTPLHTIISHEENHEEEEKETENATEFVCNISVVLR